MNITTPPQYEKKEPEQTLALKEAESQTAWSAAMEAIAEEDGHFHRLGPLHYAFFAEANPILFVTFETVAEVQARADKLPLAFNLCKKQNWSLLTILADGPTFWRAPEVWAYFDRLIDDGFFEDFDRVLFYGAGQAGYAAACYMVAAPGARGVLVSPLASLDPELTAWDQRHAKYRRLDFTTRYGYGPDMIDGAEKIWLIYDPYSQEDAAHAALYRKPWVQMLRARNGGDTIDTTLRQNQILDRILYNAANQGLSDKSFIQSWRRTRRVNFEYLRQISGRMRTAQRPILERMICRSVTQRIKAPRYIQRLAQLERELQPQTAAPPPLDASKDSAS